MAWRPTEDEGEEVLPGVALFDALRNDAVQDALTAIESDTGLPREQVIAEAVIFAGQQRRDFLSHLRGRPSRERQGPPAKRRRLLADNGVEIVVGGMFLLGALLAAIQIMLR